MAKIAGRDSSIGLEDSSGACQAISPDFSNWTLTETSESVDVTGFGATTRERVAGVITDWNLSLTGFYNAAADRAATVLTGIGAGGSTRVVIGPAGSDSGCNCYTGCATLLEYSLEASFDGAVTLSATFESRSGSLTDTTFG